MVTMAIAVGLVMVGPLKSTTPLRWDERVVTTVSHHRTSSMNSVTKLFSKLADAPSIIAVGLLVAIVLLLARRRSLAVLVPVVLGFELLSFLSITYPVGRQRPDVVHLGSVPSTGSFPSGHIAATIALYGFIALVLFYSKAAMRVVVPFVALVVVVAALVGWSRVYRGLHHPLDVAAGALLGMGVLVTFRPLVRNEFAEAVARESLSEIPRRSSPTSVAETKPS